MTLEEQPPTMACARCGQLCTLREQQQRADYPLVVLALAKTSRGMCVECAAHWWLFSVDGIRWSLVESGAAFLQWPAVQRLLTPTLTSMDAELGKLDWNRLITQWELPWPADWQLPRDRL